MAMMPHMPTIIDEEEHLVAIGQKIWIALNWSLTVEALDASSPDEVLKETDFQFWSLSVDGFDSGNDWPNPVFEPEVGIAQTFLPVAELLDAGNGELQLRQILHNDLQLAFPLMKDNTLNDDPNQGQPDDTDETDPVPPHSISISNGGTVSDDLAIDISSTVAMNADRFHTSRDHSITMIYKSALLAMGLLLHSLALVNLATLRMAGNSKVVRLWKPTYQSHLASLDYLKNRSRPYFLLLGGAAFIRIRSSFREKCVIMGRISLCAITSRAGRASLAGKSPRSLIPMDLQAR